MSDQLWTVDDHLRGQPTISTALYRQFESLVMGLGAVTVSVSKSSITFKGSRRGFAGGKPTSAGVRGYVDLMRNLGTQDRRILSVSPYQRNLYVHQFVLNGPDDLDDEFAGWIAEAYAVGCGAHLENR